MGVTGTAGFKKRLEEIQGMEQRAAQLAQQAADAEALEGTVDDVVARCALAWFGKGQMPPLASAHGLPTSCPAFHALPDVPEPLGHSVSVLVYQTNFASTMITMS